MRSKFLLFLLLLIASYSVKAEKLDGYYIDYQLDTVRVTFIVPYSFKNEEPKFSKIEKGIKYIGKNHKINLLLPQMVKEIFFTRGYRTFRMISCKNNPSIEYKTQFPYLFLQLEREGRIRVYTLNGYLDGHFLGITNFRNIVSPGGITPNQFAAYTYVMQKDNGQLFVVHPSSFRWDIQAYVYDCPSLLKKINDKYLRCEDLLSIIDMYNNNSNCELE